MAKARPSIQPGGMRLLVIAKYLTDNFTLYFKGKC